MPKITQSAASARHLAVRGVARLAPLGVTLLGGPVLLAPAVEELVVALAAGALAQGAAEQEVLAPGDGLVGAGAVKGGVVPQHAVAVPGAMGQSTGSGTGEGVPGCKCGS